MNRSFARFVRLTGTFRVPFTSFCTNGMLLNEDVVDSAIDAGFSEVIFSVDGATPGTYEDIRRGASWDRLLRSLTLLRNKKEQAGVRRPVGRFNFTCMMRNIQELPDVVRLAKAYGIASVHVRHLLGVGKEEAMSAFHHERLYMRVFNEVSAESRKVADELAVKLVVPEPIAVGRKPVSSRGSRVCEANPYCLRPWYQCIVRPNGEYFVCSRWPRMGNLARVRFAEIYDGLELRRLRRHLLSRFRSSCSWNCREEAFLAPDKDSEEST